jgi:S-adenosylmethionine:tRNA ribosyltransferase-isomerase
MHINYGTLNISEFDYYLPEEKIAKYPLKNRDSSKLLISHPTGNILQSEFNNITKYLPKDSFLVLNNTEVIFARIHFTKSSGAKIEILCLQPVDPADYQLIFGTRGECTWKCMVGNLKKWKNEILSHTEGNLHITAEKVLADHQDIHVKFRWNSELTFGELLLAAGNVPIPPYLNRPSENIDKKRYQTVYSKHKGSVAAPTAGFHFTPHILDKLKKLNIHPLYLTLHIGAGTFQPVKHENVFLHDMHSEHIIVSREFIEKLKLNRTIIAIGTTVARTLESTYWLACLIQSGVTNMHIPQFVYQNSFPKLTRAEVCEILLDYLTQKHTDHISANTQIMILPGYSFKMTDVLITNFHQPKSTLLLLIAAFVGDRWKQIYTFALENEFRFLSYGDSSLLFPSPGNLSDNIV